MPAAADSSASNSQTRLPPCELCGAAARVSVLEGYFEGQPVRRYFCLKCADSAYALFLTKRRGYAGARARSRLSWGALLIVAGTLLAVLGISADEFGIEGSVGFGWKQQIVVLLGALGVIFGAVLRVDIVTVGGSILVAAAVLADVFGIVGSPGVGWRQGAVILTGLALLSCGICLHRARSAKSARPAG